MKKMIFYLGSRLPKDWEILLSFCLGKTDSFPEAPERKKQYQFNNSTKKMSRKSNKETVLLFSSSFVALVPAVIAFAVGGLVTAIVVFFISMFLIKAAMRG